MNKQHRKSLETKLAHLYAELDECTTKAMRACVQGTIDATEWQLSGK